MNVVTDLLGKTVEVKNRRESSPGRGYWWSFDMAGIVRGLAVEEANYCRVVVLLEITNAMSNDHLPHGGITVVYLSHDVAIFPVGQL